jgi:AcrR family transcriptional regulator
VTRRSIDETRKLLLDVGLRTLYERGISVGVTHVKLGDVAAAAGLTTGAAYRCWDSQDAFHHDLAVAALGWRDRHSIASTVDSIKHLVAQHASWREVVRAGAAANLQSFRSDQSFITSIALRMCAQFDDALVSAGKERLDSALANFALLYGGLLEFYGRQVRAPYTLEHFTMMIAALSEGFVLQGMSGVEHPVVERGVTEPGVGTDWSLLGSAVEAIVEAFTEPVSSSGVPAR